MTHFRGVNSLRVWLSGFGYPSLYLGNRVIHRLLMVPLHVVYSMQADNSLNCTALVGSPRRASTSF